MLLHILGKSTLAIIFVQSILFCGRSTQGFAADDRGEAIRETHLDIADCVPCADDLASLSLAAQPVPQEELGERFGLWR